MMQDQQSTEGQMRRVLRQVDMRGFKLLSEYIRSKLPALASQPDAGVTSPFIESDPGTLRDQFRATIKVANNIGCYDAADLLLDWANAL